LIVSVSGRLVDSIEVEVAQEVRGCPGGKPAILEVSL
jgi:hypothetical protein